MKMFKNVRLNVKLNLVLIKSVILYVYDDLLVIGIDYIL